MNKVKIYIKKDLYSYVKQYDIYSYRDCFECIKLLISEPTHKLQLINGLKGTGKSTLMKQAILSLSNSDFNKAVYVEIEKDCGIEFLSILKLCKELYNDGYKYIFINGATETINFSTQAKELADTCCFYGCSIFVTGENSFAMELARNHLIGRSVEIKTTKISFAEWSRIVNKSVRNNILNYIEYNCFFKKK